MLDRTVIEAVKAGAVWLIAGPASIFKEDIPVGVLNDAATLNPPPAEILATAVLPQNLQAAWGQGVTTAAAIASALSASQGKTLPWPVVTSAIDAAIRARFLERAEDSGPWPCDWSVAASVRLSVPKDVPTPALFPSVSGGKYAEATLEPAELQDLVDGLGAILKAGAGLDLSFVLRIELPDGTMDLDQIAKLNVALEKVSPKLRLE